MCKSKTQTKFGKKENIGIWFYDLGAENTKEPKNGNNNIDYIKNFSTITL